MIEKVFGLWCQGSWQFIKAVSPDQALNIVDEQRIHLVVIDLVMPGMDGLQLLRILHKRYPDLPKVILTGNVNEESKTECLASGAVHYIEKPTTMEAMEGVYRLLDELAEAQPEGGFQGMMWHVGLQEVLQIQCLNRGSAVVEIVSGKRRGQVFIQNGAILHAEAESLTGIPALSYLLALRGGEFNFKPFAHPPEVTISGSWEAVLMEAAQAHDESGTTFLLDRAEASPRAPRVEEVVVPTPADQLPEWRSPTREALIEFFGTMQQKTKRMSEAIGPFERMEIYGDSSRLAAELTARNRIVIHMYRPANDEAPGA